MMRTRAARSEEAAMTYASECSFVGGDSGSVSGGTCRAWVQGGAAARTGGGRADSWLVRESFRVMVAARSGDAGAVEKREGCMREKCD